MDAPEFQRFWKAWPSNQGRYCRKGGKAQCLKVWNKNYNFTQADTIIKHVEWLKTTADWLKDQGAFIPAPLVYLNQQRWDGADIPESVGQPACQDSTQKLLKEMDLASKTALTGPEVAARVAAIKQKLRGQG